MLNIKKSTQVKQAAILYATTAMGVAIGVLNSVINTRFLAPSLYGDVRYIQNIIQFISSLLLVGYFVSGSRLLALSKDEQKSRQLRGVMCVILGVTIVILMASMAALFFLSDKENQNLYGLHLIAIPLCGNVLMLNYIETTAQGDNHIGRLAIARLLPSFIYCLLSFIIYSLFGATPMRMLALYNGIGIIILVWVIISTKPLFNHLKEPFREITFENKKYGFNVYLGSLAGVSTSYIAGITLGQFCVDNTNVAYYTLALTISSPLATLPAIIGTTYFKRFANENRINAKVLTTSFGMTIFSCILFVLFIGLVVNFLYDERYSVVSTYASWLTISACLHGLGDMFNRFLGSHGQGSQIRNSAFACGIAITLGSFLFVYLWHINGAILSKITGSAIYFVCLLYYYIKYTRQISYESTN